MQIRLCLNTIRLSHEAVLHYKQRYLFIYLPILIFTAYLQYLLSIKENQWKSFIDTVPYGPKTIQ